MGEVLVEVLLAVEGGAPRGGAAGAVVERAEDRAAGRVGGGLQQVAARGGAGDPELAGGVQAPVEVVAGDRRQPARTALLLDHDDGQAVRGPGDLDLLAGRVLGVVAAEHQDFVGVLVVGDEDLAAALPGQRQQGEEVVVVAELAGLGLRGLLLGMEGRGAAQDGLAPADDHVLGVAGGDGDLVGGVGRDGGEAEAAGAVGPAGLVSVTAVGDGLRGLAEHGGAADGGGDGDHGGGAQGGTAGEDTGYEVAGVLVVAGVGHLVEAGVAAAVAAGESGTAASVRVRAQERQQFAHFVLLRRSTAPTWRRDVFGGDARCGSLHGGGRGMNGA